MSEEERDYKLGLRAVVLEEFVMSFLNLPHLIALPAKALSFLLYSLPYSRYVTNRTLFFRQQFPTGLRNLSASTFETFPDIAGQLQSQYKPEYQWNFYHVQLNLLFQLCFVAIGLLEVLTWATVHCDLLMLKILSGGVYYPLNAPIPARHLLPPSGLKLLQVLQVVWMLAHIVIRTALGLAPFVLCLLYSNYSVIGCAVGPLFLNLFWYLLIYANLSTIFNVLDYFPYYAPMTNCQNAGAAVGRRAYTVSSAFFRQISLALIRLYAATKLRMSGTSLLKQYSSVLFTAGKVLKPYGLLGDLFFTPLTIVWMLWPLAIPYLLQEGYYYIPAGLLSLVLVVKGYKTAQVAWAAPGGIR